jgi:hypothetical protein
LSFSLAQSTREFENLPAFLTFSQKQGNRQMRGVKELRRPLLILIGKIFRTLGTGTRTVKMREFHAQRVKISRATRLKKISPPSFIGVFAKKTVGTGGAKSFSE